jgi:hypothetical protein
MVRPTKFKKLAAGGVDQGDISLNRFGMVPVIQKSVGVSAGVIGANGISTFRIGVTPDDGADVLEILTILDADVVDAGEGVILDFGTSADASAFGTIVVSAFGRYVLPVRNASAVPDTGTTHGSAFAVTAGTSIVVQPSTAQASFICYTTFLQNKTSDF